MREERLLERLRAVERDPVARRGKEDPRRMADSVLAHLRRILVTNQGSVPIADDYGLPDLSDHLLALPDASRDIEKMIRQAIQKFEPRLKGVRVAFVPQEDETIQLRFQVTGRLAADSRNQFFFETVIDSDGKIGVKG